MVNQNDIEKNIKTFAELGDILRQAFAAGKSYLADSAYLYYINEIQYLIKNLSIYNSWFIEDFVIKAITNIANLLTYENLTKWISVYESDFNKPHYKNKRVGVIAAGNIPLAVFHDFLCVLITNNIFVGKLSSKDDKLLPFIAEIIGKLDPELRRNIIFESANLKNIDAIIASGSNNSARYFKAYFGRYPNIIRKNRNSIAVLSGNEDGNQLKALCEDIFLYFGLGCRNVSKLIVPKDYEFNELFEAAEEYKDLYSHNKYANNYDYNKAIYLMNKVPHLDNGFLLLKEDYNIDPPTAVIYYQFYKNIDEVNRYIQENKEKIQCVVSNNSQLKGTIPFGMAQKPELWDYADEIDTIKFLLNL
jgi:hypothetical protein